MINSISRVFNLHMFFTISFVLLILGGFWIYDLYSKYQSDIKDAEDKILQEQKNITKSNVQNIITFIDKKRDYYHKNSLELIKNQVHEAHSVATSIYNMYKDTKNLQEIKDLVRETLRVKRFNKGRGYFFATNLNGIEELFADRPQLEGKNLLSMRDTKGNYVIKDMIKIAKTKGEGFYEYYWTKPNTEGNDHKKISYIKYFKPFDWFIGTGEYYEDLEEDIKKEVFDLLNSVNIHYGNYFFVIDYEGKIHVHINKDFIGKNMIDLKDSDGLFVVKEIITTAKATGGDFVEYQFKKPTNKHNESLPKISYVVDYKTWGVIIGSGFYIDDVSALIKSKQADIKKDITNKIQLIILILFFSIFTAFLINKFFYNKIREGFEVFHTFFKNANLNREYIDVKRLFFKEFQDLSKEANDMLEKKMIAELELAEISYEYKMLFDKMIDGFAVHQMIFDKEGKPLDYKFISVNKAFEDITGLKAKEIIGKTVLEILPDIEYYWIETYARVVTTGEPVHFENFNNTLGKYFEVTAYKQSEDLFACILVDITQRVLMYKNLEELTRTLEERVSEEVEKQRKQEVILIQQSKLASMAEMLISISHHWRQPLNAIGLVVQSLEDLYDNNELTNEQIQWTIKTVMDMINGMSNTINTFSDYFNIQSTNDNFDIETSLQKTFSIVSEDYNLNKIKLSILFLEAQKSINDISQSTSNNFVAGDVNSFQQVLLAILTNAKEAIIERQKKVPLEKEFFVKIILDARDKNILLRIEDNAGGINQEIIDRIFEPYFTTKEKSFTVGLGLYMAKIIIEEHMKGKLYVENIEDGCAFIIELPKISDVDYTMSIN